MEASLARWLLDFTVIYGIAAEALPLLLEELWNDAGWYNRARNGGGGGEETAGLLLNLSLYHFFIEKDAPPAWPLVKPLLPPKILQRKEGTPGEGIDAPGEPWEQAARTLEALDRRLREDWGRGFFAFFCPPRPVKAEFKAFRGLGGMGESSYTACWLDFSSHKPLIEALSALALNPLASPLPGVKIRPRPLGLEGELVEELRRESEEVRDLLKTGAPEEAPPRRERPAAKGLSGPGYGFSGLKLTGPPVLSRSVLEDFLAGLGDTERDALRKIVTNAGGGVPDLIVNGINEAFYGRFGDILVESSPAGPSISAGYGSILMEWE
jgi:hypothetical protein